VVRRARLAAAVLDPAVRDAAVLDVVVLDAAVLAGVVLVVAVLAGAVLAFEATMIGSPARICNRAGLVLSGGSGAGDLPRPGDVPGGCRP
jgi:hypothetical protein